MKNIIKIFLSDVRGLVKNFFALVIAISYMLSGYYGLYSEQKILYSKLKPRFIDRKTK